MAKGELRPSLSLALAEADMSFPRHLYERLRYPRRGEVRVFHPVGAWGRVSYPLVATITGDSDEETNDAP